MKEIHEENQKKQVEEKVKFDLMREENEKLKLRLKDLEERAKEERYTTPPSTQGDFRYQEAEIGRGRKQRDTEECKKNLSFLEETQGRRTEQKGQERSESKEAEKDGEIRVPSK